MQSKSKEFTSLFDSTVLINEQKSAVTIVHRGQHSGLLIESWHPTGGYVEVRYGHFFPDKEVREREGPQDGFFQKSSKGEVDIRPFHKNRPKRGEVFEFFQLSSATTTYPISQTEAKQLIDHITAQKRKEIPVPIFQIRGGYVNEDGAFNCRSWVREELSLIKITVSSNFVDRTCSDTLNCNDVCVRDENNHTKTGSGCTIL